MRFGGINIHQRSNNMSPINSQSRNTNSNNDTGGGSLLRNLRNRKSEDPITNRTNKTFDQQRHIEKAFKGLSLTLGRKRPEIPSQDEYRNKIYRVISVEELHSVQLMALKRLNSLLKSYGGKPLKYDVVRSAHDSCYGISGGKKWWPWSRKDEIQCSNDNKVTKTLLVKSLEYASVPYDPELGPIDTRRIPVIVYECINFITSRGLTSRGIFRVNGSDRRIHALADQFNRSPYGSRPSFEHATVYDVADLLKKYLRELPEPVFTTDLYPYFIKYQFLTDDIASKTKIYQLLLLLLPSPHLSLFCYVLNLLTDIASLSQQNQMNSNSLARVISPNLLRSKELQSLQEYADCASVLSFMISNSRYFGLVEDEVIITTILEEDIKNMQPCCNPRPIPNFKENSVIPQESNCAIPSSSSAASASASFSNPISSDSTVLGTQLKATLTLPRVALTSGPLKRWRSTSTSQSPQKATDVRRTKTAPSNPFNPFYSLAGDKSKRKSDSFYRFQPLQNLVSPEVKVSHDIMLDIDKQLDTQLVVPVIAKGALV